MLKKNTILSVVGIFLITAFAVWSQNAKLVDGTGTERIVAAAGKEYNSGMTLVSDSLVAVTAATTKVQVIWCNNITSSAANLTLTDTAGVSYATTVPIAGNSIALIHNSLVGIPMAGIKWQAGTAKTLYCQVVGVQ